mmetsp:Transcript_82496/g.237214  ORF Transcript_82496/g.237214 Transcript_82496/m.237214 type:complete len:263 (-) Transcript_82496:505-1293(-)
MDVAGHLIGKRHDRARQLDVHVTVRAANPGGGREDGGLLDLIRDEGRRQIVAVQIHVLFLDEVVLVVGVDDADDVAEELRPSGAVVVPAEMLRLLQDQDIPGIVLSERQCGVPARKDAPHVVHIFRAVPTDFQWQHRRVDLRTLTAPLEDGFLLLVLAGEGLAGGEDLRLVLHLEPGHHEHDRPAVPGQVQGPKQRVHSCASQPRECRGSDDREMPVVSPEIRGRGTARNRPKGKERRLSFGIEKRTAELLHDACACRHANP